MLKLSVNDIKDVFNLMIKEVAYESKSDALRHSIPLIYAAVEHFISCNKFMENSRYYVDEVKFRDLLSYFIVEYQDFKNEDKKAIYNFLYEFDLIIEGEHYKKEKFWEEYPALYTF